MEGWLLQNQPHHPQWPKVLHPAHVGPATDPHHGPGHTKRCDHEHLDGLLQQGVHHQEAGQRRHGDCCLYPEHPRGKS